MKKNGFVFMETLIVISVLTLTLTLLFTSYSYILNKTKTRNSYDNEETIYKTFYVEELLKDTKGIDGIKYGTVKNFITKSSACKKMGSYNSYVCEIENVTNENISQVYQMKTAFEVSKLYYLNPKEILESTDTKWILSFDASTIDYIKYLGKSINKKILIIKYKKAYGKKGDYEIYHSSNARWYNEV